MTKFIITQKLTDKEKYKLNLLWLIKSGMLRKILPVLLIPVLIVGVLDALTFNPKTDKIGEPNFLLILIYPTLMILVLFLGPWLLIKFKKSADNIYEFDDWGMTIKSGDNTRNFSWNELSEFTETGDFVLIRQTSNHYIAHFISKRELRDQQTEKDFIDLLLSQRLRRT